MHSVRLHKYDGFVSFVLDSYQFALQYIQSYPVIPPICVQCTILAMGGGGDMTRASSLSTSNRRFYEPAVEIG